MKKIIKTNEAPAAVGPYSQAIMLDDFLFTSGQIGLDPKSGKLVEGGVEGQSKRVFENLSALLKEAGMDFSNVVKTMVFIKDINDFGKVNEIYAGYFKEDLPARSCVEIGALPKGALIEIELIAHK
jgi:2-iminobutanoate/2-iminopropanoate deaminase